MIHAADRPTHLLAKLALQEALARPATLVRSLTLGALAVAGIVYFASVMPATHFEHTGTFERAAFDAAIVVNGDSETLRKTLAAAEEVNAAVAVTAVGEMTITGKRDETVSAPVTFVLDGSRDLTYFSREMILQGSCDPDGDTETAWGVDLATSRELGLHLGDSVSGQVTVLSSTSMLVTHAVSGTIGAIYAPTREVNGFIAPKPGWLTGRALPNSGLLTRVFVQDTTDNDGVAAITLGRLTNPDLLVTTLSDELGTGVQRFESILNRNTRFSLTWFCVALYVAYFAREQTVLVRRHAKDLAVFLSLGMTPAEAARALMYEHAAITAITSVLGAALGSAVLRWLNLYIPPDAYVALAIYAVLANAATLTWGRIRFVRRIQNLPVAALLAPAE